MKKLLLATVSVVALAGSAMAADLPVYRPAPVVAAAPACAQFGGFYIGGQAGYDYYDHRFSDRDSLGSATFDASLFPARIASEISASDSAFSGGVYGGYNYQVHCTVFGLEGDWNWSTAKASGTAFDAYQGGGVFPPNSIAVDSKLRSYGSFRLRSGIVVDSLLLYVTGGVVGASFDRNWTYTQGFVDSTLAFADSPTRWGWTAGVGTEWAWTPSISIKSEFLYSRFGHDSVSVPGTTGVFGLTGQSYRLESEDSMWTTRLGIAYHFNAAAPVVARY